MNKFVSFFIFFMFILGLLWPLKIISQTRHFPSGTDEVFIAKANGIRPDLLLHISPIIKTAIAKGHYPGAVILVGHRGQIIYRGVFGNRRILPNIAPMRFDTIFDIASLTKVVATTPAIMQLVEQGKINIDAPVALYWPAFAKNNKSSVTVRELLTHTSGLPAEIPHQTNLTNENDALKRVIQLKLHHAPGTKFLYSDVNFLVLAHLVEIISKQDIVTYAKNKIFKPLQMNNTFFNPDKKLQDRIAPTEVMDNKLRWGKVHDPLAYALGGAAGNAGAFSTAADLGLYAQSLLNGGTLPTPSQGTHSNIHHFLGPLSIVKMTTPQTPAHLTEVRGFGWDIDSQYSNRGILFPTQSYGHTGWTGTSLWIDPMTQTWMVILTSRSHPHPAKNNQLIKDRRTIANIVSASIVDIPSYSFNNTGKGELNRAYR